MPVMSAPTIGVGVVGLGFMGRVHVRAVQAAGADGLPCRLAAVCSDDPAQLTGRPSSAGNLGPAAGDQPLFNPRAIHVHSDAADLASDPGVHLVCICTPTDTHVALASMMLRAGKHVIVEKPVALRSGDVRELAKVATASARLCMPGLCMRFWPGWDWLKARATDQTFGAVRCASFTRLGCGPTWSPEFYRDPARSGSALFDLHVHDADFVLHLLGAPAAVRSVGSVEHLCTQYIYPGGPAPVVAEGGWVGPAGFPFRMRYTVEFESAVADWDMARGGVVMVTRDGRTEPIALPERTAYESELRAMIAAVSEERATPPVTLDDALRVTLLLEAERRSLDSGRPEDVAL